jgi:hypothetical protein
VSSVHVGSACVSFHSCEERRRRAGWDWAICRREDITTGMPRYSTSLEFQMRQSPTVSNFEKSLLPPTPIMYMRKYTRPLSYLPSSLFLKPSSPRPKRVLYRRVEKAIESPSWTSPSAISSLPILPPHRQGKIIIITSENKSGPSRRRAAFNPSSPPSPAHRSASSPRP